MDPYSSKEQVMQELSRAFGKFLDFEVIETVAQNCSYNVDEASVMLSQISHGLDEKTNSDNTFQVVDRKKKKETRETSPDEVELRYQKELDIQRVVQFIKEGWKVVVLLRGVPGSGKTYLANTILKESLGQVNRKDFILSTDDYFSKSGIYEFNAAALPTAHTWNQKRCFSAMRRGYSPLLIDNTNLEVWQMKPYCLMAAEFGYCIEVVEPITWWAMNPNVLEERNVHGVHKGKIMELLSRYEPNITTDVLVRLCNLKYHHVLPQYRRYPDLEKITSQDFDNSEIPNYSWKLQDKPIQTVPLEYVDTMRKKSVDELLDMKKDKDIGNDCAVLKASAELKSSNSPQKQYSAANSINDFEDLIKASGPRIPTDTASFESKVELQPSLFGNLQQQLQSLKDNKETSTDLRAWGLTEKALFSWELFQPVTEQQPQPPKAVPVQDVQVAETSDGCTNTCAADFMMALDKSKQGTEKILLGQNRDITSGIGPAPLSPRKKIVVDQSCMTNQEALLNLSKEENSSSKDIQKLVALFPTIPTELLTEIYEKCHKDINWTVDLLMDNGVGNLSSVTAKTNLKQVELNNETTEDLISFELNSSPKIKETNTEMEDQKLLDALRLKRYIENNVDISKEHYSPYVWELKNIKRNRPSPAKQEVNGKSPLPSQQPPNITEQTLGDETVYYSDEDNETNDQLLEINLGEDLAEHLEGLFGKIDCGIYKPVVQMPESLAKQLHALLLESAARQIDSPGNLYEDMLAQDQAFAMQLQEEERSAASNLNEIMDNEYANNLYMKDVEKWKNLSPDDLASKLTRQKLCETFPNINKDILFEILQAHNNCYKLTVETLLASTDPIANAPSNLFEPPISQNTLEEMKMAQEPALGPDEDNDERSAISYREEANYYMRKHKDILELMRQYRQRGMHEVAVFYSGLAKKQIQLAEYANQRASYAFIQENGAKQKDSTTLDLHYLYVKEALSSLDIFLDHQISRLTQKNISSEHMFIITGRGRRSESGQSRLKPAVMKRLNKRKIQFHQVNPGLLRIKVQKNLLMSTDI